MASSTRAVHYDIEASSSQQNGPSRHSTSVRSDPDVSNIPPTPILKRRTTRSSTFKTVNDNPARVNWRAGQEPGLDPSKPNGGRARALTLHEECQITVVDFSEDDMHMRDMDNAQLISFLEEEQEDWIKCRWINVNGLSWDVIQAVGKYKKLHRLAIEDLVNTNNRTKADWYADHTYIVLTLQKLIHLPPEEGDSDFDSDDEWPVGEARRKRKRGLLSRFKRNIGFSRNKRRARNSNIRTPGGSANSHDPITGRAHTNLPGVRIDKLRTLQGYHRGPNQERMEFLESHSALTKKRLAVSAEQVSIFLTAGE
jgi:hypothetical protein